MRKTLLGFIFAGMLAGGAMAADVVVRVAPPRVRVEHRGPRPGRDYVWVNGYQRWEGNRYVWAPGRWERPPHSRARWVSHRWVHRNGGWTFVEGHWR